MMHIFRKSKLVLYIFIIIVILASCSSLPKYQYTNDSIPDQPYPIDSTIEDISPNTNQEPQDIPTLIWYQLGFPQEDLALVLEQVNAYTRQMIGVEIDIRQEPDFDRAMQTLYSTGGQWDITFTSSWTNNYLQNVKRGIFLPLSSFLETQGQSLYQSIDSRFWDAARVDGEIYAIPTQKEISYMPMWVFCKELVERYHIPYEDIHSLEDLEPYLRLMKEHEPDIIPLFLHNGFSIPFYMDFIQFPLGVHIEDDTLTIQNVFEMEKTKTTLRTMRRFHDAGYINSDAMSASEHDERRRFVTKASGQPFAENIWSKELGYQVVASPIISPIITNDSARGAMTAINANTQYPEQAFAFIQLVQSSSYLRNLLNYGIEGVHYDLVPASYEELLEVQGRPYVFPSRVRLHPERMHRYQVPYFVQGGLFHTYVLEGDPLDKWAIFEEYNQNSVAVPSFGFNFDLRDFQSQIRAINGVLDPFVRPLYSGFVVPEAHIEGLLQKLESVGIREVMEEMQRQIDVWAVLDQ